MDIDNLLPNVRHQRIDANGLTFHVATAGPDKGPLVMLLHGFPEFWYGWRHQIGALVEAGLSVAAPDQRGYGTSDKPASASAYILDTLADDVVAIGRALGQDRFLLVGHDWGGMVAWHLAARHPKLIERMAILNAPHPATFASYALTHPMQLLRSTYVAWFQLPWLPEAVLRANSCSALKRALTGSSKPGAFDDVELERYRQAWEQDGALTAMLNWYRAMPLARPSRARITMPVRVLWGDADSALGKGLAEAALRYCDQGEVTHVPGATHWLHHEKPAAVNDMLIHFLAA
jgi:pimeloyl-ACP methyl ester carboxylesterase